jgi:hypothetical protein
MITLYVHYQVPGLDPMERIARGFALYRAQRTATTLNAALLSCSGLDVPCDCCQ